MVETNGETERESEKASPDKSFSEHFSLNAFTEVVPSASSFIESLRDIGYSFKHAVADLIDNSITAGADEVDIDVEIGRNMLAVEVRDNGSGMSREELLTAMRLGSRNPREVRETDDLGRFGLGLKTASFSQCRRLSVFTRRQGNSSGAEWDLDHVQETDRWEIRILKSSEVGRQLTSIEGDGTIVRWDDLDRLAQLPLTDQDIADITSQIDETRTHLEIVFHRFLSGERGYPPILIRLNGRDLRPFDPFWESHSHTTATPPEPERISFRDGIVSLQAFTLPHHSNCSRDEWDAHAGPGGYVSNQGFYLYRARRLLVWGSWFGLDRKRATNQLCRVRIDVDNSLDADWKVDIRKSFAQPPIEIRRRLKALVDSMMGGTRRVYRQRGQRLVSKDAYPIWLRHVGDSGYYYLPDASHPFMEAFQSQLDPDAKEAFRKILTLIGASLPYAAILSDAGDNPNGQSAESIAPELRADMATDIVGSLVSKGISIEEAMAATSRYPAFALVWAEIESEVRKKLDIKEDSEGEIT